MIQVKNLNDVFEILRKRELKRIDFDFGEWHGCAYWIGKNVIRIDLKHKEE